MMRRNLLLLFSTLFIALAASSQVPILYYDFENNTTRTTFENLVELSMNTGSGPLTRAGNTTTISSVGGAGTFNGGAAAGQAATSSNWQSGVSDPGTAATNYLQFTVNTTGLADISVSFDNQASATGPAGVGVLWSNDGTNFTSATSVSSGNAAFAQTGIIALGSGADNQSTVTIRIYGYAGDRTGRSTFGTGGTFRVDNLTVYAKTFTASKTLLDHTLVGLGIKSGTAYNPVCINLTVNGPGAVVSLASALNMINVVSVLNGQISLGNYNLNLVSNPSSTGSIGLCLATTPFAYGGTGLIVSQKYIAGGGLSTASPSQRAYRFLAHPFSSAIALNQLQTAIDITGTGTGFDATASGAPSAFAWNQATANGNIGGSGDGGWNAITNTTTADWAQYKAMRVFYRGTKGTGLNGVAYTVGSATLSMTGVVNTGDQTINLSYPNGGTTTNYNFVGNPYASNVYMAGVTNTNTTSSFYVWNLALGTRGAYSTVNFGSAYTLPAYAGFFVETNGASPSVVFHETDKTSIPPTNTLLRNNGSNQVTIQIKSGSILWDELQLESNKQANAAYEYADARKLKNQEVSLYTISSNNVDLAIDKRNIQAGDIIPLGLSSNASRTFTIEFGTMNINNVELYLHDKYLGTEQKVEAGSSYTFSTNTEAASQGNARFELVAKQLPFTVLVPSVFTVKIAPNPTTELVKVTFTNEEELVTTIQLVDALGRIVNTVNAGKVLSGEAKINVSSLSKGSYFVHLNNGKQTRTEKLQVQ